MSFAPPRQRKPSGAGQGGAARGRWLPRATTRAAVGRCHAAAGEHERSRPIELHRAGVRALRFNLKRGGSEDVGQLERMARRVHDLVGRHVELCADAADLAGLCRTLLALRAVGIEHLGLTRAGLPTLLELVEHGVRVRAHRLRVRRPRWRVRASRLVPCGPPDALMFGTDLPSTRAPHPYADSDMTLIVETLGDAHAEAMEFGRMPAAFAAGFLVVARMGLHAQPEPVHRCKRTTASRRSVGGMHQRFIVERLSLLREGRPETARRAGDVMSWWRFATEGVRTGPWPTFWRTPPTPTCTRLPSTSRGWNIRIRRRSAPTQATARGPSRTGAGNEPSAIQRDGRAPQARQLEDGWQARELAVGIVGRHRVAGQRRNGSRAHDEPRERVGLISL